VLGERFFQAAFDAAPDGIVVFDDQGRYVYANPAAAEIYGLAPDELIGRRIGDFTPDSRRDRIDEKWQELRERPALRGRARMKAADGTERLVEYSVRASFLEGRHVSVFRELAAGREHLTPREAEVLQLLARGLNGSRVAARLGIAPETVRTHVRNAMDKLGARTRAHAMALAFAHGEIDLDQPAAG
jgi:PAS domain S-box-containing protein